jgi:hypothetical protein
MTVELHKTSTKIVWPCGIQFSQPNISVDVISGHVFQIKMLADIL